MTAKSFIEELLRVVPELRPAYEIHLVDNATLLPHVFMGDVARFVVVESASHEKQSTLVHLVGFLENALTDGGKEIQELIAASFVENLIGETKALQSLKVLMGPNLKRQVETICG
jgi:hypothetical protein